MTAEGPSGLYALMQPGPFPDSATLEETFPLKLDKHLQSHPSRKPSPPSALKLAWTSGFSKLLFC